MSKPSVPLPPRMSEVDVLSYQILAALVREKIIYVPILEEINGELLDDLLLTLKATRRAIIQTWPYLNHEVIAEELPTELPAEAEKV